MIVVTRASKVSQLPRNVKAVHVTQGKADKRRLLMLVGKSEVKRGKL